MAEDLICPDCGGVIGGSGVDSEGRSPCSCYKEAVVTKTQSDEREDSSDTVSLPSQPAAGGDTSPKLCFACGKNVSGHRRVKDSRGYMCYDCAKAEVKQEKAGTIPCADCKKRLKEGGLVMYKGRRICKTCHGHLSELDRKSRKVATKEIDEYEKRNIYVLGGIFGVLTLIILWQLVKRLFF